ncbi:M35 family metallo-endopeptidase [Iodobacter sp. CM08]|uniref:M35 family metallo-endopeptidase n=1 Tax=Iodobacter sp. CM08 TaxID=3085902 RepID=UPI00298261A3|nr:M35 family metallo-endopeptidase [Iodobacter sp. CM08]MDW5415764.1 M35 family metallo-endopeptidase [Iodobacter sp. CM08]
MIFKKGFRTYITVLAAALGFSGHVNAQDVAISLSFDKNTLSENDDVFVNVTMKNTTSSPQYILKWHTPFIAAQEALFDVYRDGVKVNYLGPMVKRPAPIASDFFELKPGAIYQQKVELSALYDMRVSGNYTIQYRANAPHVLTDKKSNGISQEALISPSDSVNIWINGSLPRGSVSNELAPESLAGGALTLSQCSASQTALVKSAFSAAQTMSQNGDSYLQAGTNSVRYSTWFGKYDSARYATVKSHYVAIKDAFLNKPVTVDCGCKDTYFAYVYPNQPYKIYVCNAFWTAPLTGTDSKGGTLVHEMSHFYAVASTKDNVYGQSGAKKLAISDPAKAIANADSHEYFVENTPSQP